MPPAVVPFLANSPTRRVRALIESCVATNHRSLFVIVGDKGRHQAVNLHYILSKVGSERGALGGLGGNGRADGGEGRCGKDVERALMRCGEYCRECLRPRADTVGWPC